MQIGNPCNGSSQNISCGINFKLARIRRCSWFHRGQTNINIVTISSTRSVQPSLALISSKTLATRELAKGLSDLAGDYDLISPESNLSGQSSLPDIVMLIHVSFLQCTACYDIMFPINISTTNLNMFSLVSLQVSASFLIFTVLPFIAGRAPLILGVISKLSKACGSFRHVAS